MNIASIIRKKRNGDTLTNEEIGYFVAGLADSTIAPEQVAALAMAIYFNSLSDEETSALTIEMAQSGEILDWSQEKLGGPVVDKHSTGGVGDKVSFVLAPILAACGCFVPMISGRGLGHSGGTLDKIESVPGYQTQPEISDFKNAVKAAGCAIIGQTDALAPADRRLYAIRDITATVESIPLITASILSKKIAGGLDALVMDVKTGSGAFMPSIEAARALGDSLVGAGVGSGLKTRALITDMSQPLGVTAGNAVEIREVVRYLRNEERDGRLDDVVCALSAELLDMVDIESDAAAARQRIDDTISSGSAAEVFGQMIASLGGPKDFVENYDRYLPNAKFAKPVYAEHEGYLTAVNTREIGMAIISLRGGRLHRDDKLDLSTGFTEIAPIGAMIDKSQPLAIIHASRDSDLERAAEQYRNACTISQDPPQLMAPILERVV